MLLLLALNLATYAQVKSIVADFSIAEEGQKIYLSWTVTQGNTCNGVRVFRSTDSITFIDIGGIAGVCGSLEEPQRYSFVDKSPLKNRVNHYRLDLGGWGLSHVVSAEVVSIDVSDLQVRPNPMIDYGRIYFENKSHDIYNLSVYNMGRGVEYTDATQEEYFDINVSGLDAGTYIFTISTDDKIVSGKFTITH